MREDLEAEIAVFREDRRRYLDSRSRLWAKASRFLAHKDEDESNQVGEYIVYIPFVK